MSVPPSMAPFPLLLTSRSRRTAREGSSFKDVPSYLILMQHTLPLHQRISSSMPRLRSDSREKQVYDRANLREPGEVAHRDSCGSALVREAFEVLCRKHGGAVVLVRVADNIDLLDRTHSPVGGTKAVKPCGLPVDAIGMWRDRGVVVDLCSDPFGWDDDGVTALSERMIGGRSENGWGPAVIRSAMDDLEAVAGSIERAAATVCDRGKIGHCDALTNNTFNTGNAATTSNEDGSNQSSRLSNPTSVPVIFDSLTQFLNVHGVDNTMALVTRLRRMHWWTFHSGGPSGRENSHHTRESASLQDRVMLSPILLPTLTETVHLRHQRIFEDASDAVVTLSGGELNVIRRSLNSGKVTNEMQPFHIASWRTHKGQFLGTSTIQLGDNIVQEEKCDKRSGMPVAGLHISPEASEQKNKVALSDNETKREVQVENDVLPGDLTFKLGRLTSKEQQDRASTILPYRIKTQQYKKMVVLSHQEQDGETPCISRRVEGPRIFLQDDDPHFDDLDEEDPDDDLDL